MPSLRSLVLLILAAQLQAGEPARTEQPPSPQPPALTLLSGGLPATGTTFASRHQLSFRLRLRDGLARPGLRFQTRLGGEDAAWGESTARTTFEFTNLREGVYAFSARTVDALGRTSAPITLPFTIRPPWYRSPWAYAGCATLFLAGVYGIMRYREARIRARAAQLEKLVVERTAELVKANAAKDEFLAGMSHEIRNPMNGVVGLTAAIDTTRLDAEGRHRFELLRHCASHLASLLEDILDYSKLQSGAIELDSQPFSVAELLESAAAITSDASGSAGLPVDIALGPSVPPRLVGDARRIRQILLNYLGNALKYAPAGQIDVTVWARPAVNDHATVTFAVTDQGPGIPAEAHDRIFEKFERGPHARGIHIPGTGMGLAVCRQLAIAMGGRAWVESTPGEGATFFLELDLPVAAPLAALSAPDLPAARRRVLVVDDEEYNVISLAALLERHGYEVTRTLRAQQALELAAQQEFGAVLIDYDLPEINGPDLARRLRARPTTRARRPLLIATTAYSSLEVHDECRAAGMDGYLGKPITEEKLLRLLQSLQTLRPAAAGAPAAPDRPPAAPDPLHNLRPLAREHRRTLRAELAEFGCDASDEFVALDAALRARDPAAVAGTAHKLVGRFGFLACTTGADRARRLMQAGRDAEWDAAVRLRAEVGREWSVLQDTLARLTAPPGA